MSDDAIAARDLVKTYPGDVRAVRGVSPAVPAGTVFGLLGPNGAGKSTTVKILTTLTTATSGSAVVAGHDLARRPDAVRRAIGCDAECYSGLLYSPRPSFSHLTYRPRMLTSGSPCKTADSTVSYSLSSTELAGRDYMLLASSSVSAWANTSTPLIFSEVSSASHRDVLVGALDYGNTGFYGITQPSPACVNTYGGIWPVMYTYSRLNTNCTNPWPSSRVRYTFEHELGQMLGLTHPVENSSFCPPVAPSVMLPSDTDSPRVATVASSLMM